MARTQSSDCVRYRFIAGDSLVYKVECIDTVDIIGDQGVVIRNRTEFQSLVCDHVDEHGSMYVRQTLESFVSSERYLNDTSVSTRRTSPWIGRSTYLIIDSMTTRLLARQLDTSHAALSPGGAFAPSLLAGIFDSSCHSPTDRPTWMIQRLDTLAENGYPYPLVRHLYSCSVKDSLYTGIPCYRVIYAETGQASFKTVTDELAVYMHSVIDAHGLTLISKKELQPLQIEAHQKLRITIVREHSERRGTIQSHQTIQRIFSNRR